MCDSFFFDAAKLQTDYAKLIQGKRLTKRAMCELCIPFRDKYGLTDLQTLMIAREEMPLNDMAELVRHHDL